MASDVDRRDLDMIKVTPGHQMLEAVAKTGRKGPRHDCTSASRQHSEFAEQLLSSLASRLSVGLRVFVTTGWARS
jgi:hypothetical protein